MSEQVISQKLKRICDGCGKEFVYEMVDTPDEVITEMTQWIVLARQVADSKTGRFIGLKGQACSLPCVNLAALKLAQVPSNMPDDIDLSGLRMATDPTSN